MVIRDEDRDSDTHVADSRVAGAVGDAASVSRCRAIAESAQ